MTARRDVPDEKTTSFLRVFSPSKPRNGTSTSWSVQLVDPWACLLEKNSQAFCYFGVCINISFSQARSQVLRFGRKSTFLGGQDFCLYDV